MKPKRITNRFVLSGSDSLLNFKVNRPAAQTVGRYANKIVLNKRIVGYMINILENNSINFSRLRIQHINLS